MAFATAAGLYLSFDYKTFGVVEGLGNLEGFFGGARQSALLHVDAKLAHQLLRVELVQVKEALWCGNQRHGTEGVGAHH